MNKADLKAVISLITNDIVKLQADKDVAEKLGFNTQCSALTHRIRLAEKYRDELSKFL